jgi:hypothetical protein
MECTARALQQQHKGNASNTETFDEKNRRKKAVLQQKPLPISSIIALPLQ